jgi:hypothetical protein
VDRWGVRSRGFLIGRPDFVPRARRYAHLTRIQPGFYRFEEFSDR